MNTYTQEATIDQIEIVSNGVVLFRTVNKLISNSENIVANFIRDSVAPGDDYNNKDEKVQAICKIVHTPDVIEAYRLQLATNPIIPLPAIGA